MPDPVWTRYSRCAEYVIGRVIVSPFILFGIGWAGLGTFLACSWLCEHIADPPPEAAVVKETFRLVIVEAILAALLAYWRHACALIDGRD